MHNIEIEIINNPTLRQKFITNFLLSWDEFQMVRKDFIKNLAKAHKIVFNQKMYEESLMWDKMPSEYKQISFTEALNALKSINQKVIFMSETDNYPSASPLNYQNQKIPSFIAQANAEALASLIEHEWFESYRLAELYMYNPDFILPEDLYVFDETMKWVIVFTHETTDWETENLMEEAESRLCIIHIKRESHYWL